MAWAFDDFGVTFDNPAYLFDGTGPDNLPPGIPAIQFIQLELYEISRGNLQLYWSTSPNFTGPGNSWDFSNPNILFSDPTVFFDGTNSQAAIPFSIYVNNVVVAQVNDLQAILTGFAVDTDYAIKIVGGAVGQVPVQSVEIGYRYGSSQIELINGSPTSQSPTPPIIDIFNPPVAPPITPPVNPPPVIGPTTPVGPAIPTSVTAVAGNGTVSVFFTPGDPGTQPYTGFTAVFSNGTTVTGTSSPLTRGIPNGTTVTATVFATTTVGSSLPSALTAPVTPQAPVIQTVPGAPSVVATAGNATISIVITPSATTGNSPTTNYRVTTTPATSTLNLGTKLTGTIQGLANGTSYTVNVVATNGVGDSLPGSSISVTPAAPPSTSTMVSINASGLVVDQGGNALELIGTNYSGLNTQMIYGFSYPTSWGNNQTGADPNWRNFSQYKLTLPRIIINVLSFLAGNYRLLTGTTNANAGWGATANADFLGDFKPTIWDAVDQARENGEKAIIMDCHCSAPQATLGGVTAQLAPVDQPPFMDYDNCSIFWGDTVKSLPAMVAATFGSAAYNSANGYNGGNAGARYNPLYGGSTGFGDIIFELFNEPFFSNITYTLYTRAGTFGNAAWKANNGGSQYTCTDGGTPPDTPGHTSFGAYTAGQEFVMLYGGYCNFFSFNNNVYLNGRGVPSTFKATNGAPGALQGAWPGNPVNGWRVYGYQEAVNAIAALNIPNILLCNGQGFASLMTPLKYFMPDDPRTAVYPQLGCGVHWYEDGTTGYPSTLDPGQGTATAFTPTVAAAAGTSGLGRRVPVFITEYGTQSLGSSPQPDPFIQHIDSLADAQTKGSMHLVIFCQNGPPAAGTTSATLFVNDIYQNPVTITGSILGNILTVTSGSGILDGMAITGGAAKGVPYIGKFGKSGTTGTGGKGTYWISIPQTVASKQLQVSALTPASGQGKTFNAFSTAHA